MPNFPADRTRYQWAPHRSTPRRAAWEGLVLLVVGLLCAVLTVESILL